MSAAEQPDSEDSKEDQEIEEATESKSEEKDNDWDGDDENKENENDEVLSNEEREALSEDVEQLTDEAGATIYDFYSPAHINKSSLPAFSVINEKITDSMSDDLINLLQRDVEVTVDDINIVRYADFIHSLPPLVDTNIIHVNKLDCEILVCIDGSLIELIMDSYFGGEGKLSESNDKELFTNTEINMSNKILDMFLVSNKNAWEKTEKLDFQYVQRELQPKLINLLAESDLVVVCQFVISLDGEVGNLKMAYPYKSLEPIKHSLRNIVPEKGDENDMHWKRKLFNSVKAAPIELNTILADFNLTVDEVVKLKTGDVIPFSMPESVTVYSREIPIFNGKIGTVNDSVAVSINSWIRNNER